MTGFSAQVYQNEYLPAGADVVDAVITVTSSGDGASSVAQVTPTHQAVEVIIVDTSGSMKEDGGAKIRAARYATQVAVDSLRDGVLFAVVSGTDRASSLYPRNGLAVSSPATRAEANRTIERVPADGGTAIGTWLRYAANLFSLAPGGIHHAILLTDGKNQHESDWELDAAIQSCIGLFQCDCRGLGTSWNIEELRKVANALLGTVDIIPRPEDMAAEFLALTTTSMSRQVGQVALRLWTPKGSQVQYLRQVAPSIEELTDKGQPVNNLTNDYPLGAWSGEEERDYHLRVQVPAGQVGEERLGARVMLAVDGVEQPAALVRAIWTDDERLSTRINREVAHYTGQAELAEAIHDGLAARDAGDADGATVKLGRAVQLAHEAGNADTVKLLEKVVDVDNPAEGTVRLRRNVEQADAMALDVRSTRTVRVNKPGE